MWHRENFLWRPRKPGSDGLLPQRALPGLTGEFIGAHTGARLQELRLELLRLALLLERHMSGDLPRPTRPDLRLARLLRL